MGLKIDGIKSPNVLTFKKEALRNLKETGTFYAYKPISKGWLWMKDDTDAMNVCVIAVAEKLLSEAEPMERDLLEAFFDSPAELPLHYYEFKYLNVASAVALLPQVIAEKAELEERIEALQTTAEYLEQRASAGERLHNFVITLPHEVEKIINRVFKKYENPRHELEGK